MGRKELVNQSIDYIMQHLDEDLSLDTIAAAFYISKYHFSRIFKEETGESIYAFIKRCKVDQSAIDIKLNPTKSITDIGPDYGYSSSNYSSVFRKHRDTSPTMFKQSIPTHSMPVPFTPERVVHFKTAEEYGAKIEIRELNDPSITILSQCICDICMTVEQDCDLDNVMWIKDGKWIVYHFNGEIKNIFETLQGIFSVWLPQSGYKMAQRYGLNIYHHIDWENHRVVMDLYIPTE